MGRDGEGWGGMGKDGEERDEVGGDGGVVGGIARLACGIG